MTLCSKYSAAQYSAAQYGVYAVRWYSPCRWWRDQGWDKDNNTTPCDAAKSVLWEGQSARDLNNHDESSQSL